MKKLAGMVVGALVATALTIGFAANATAEPAQAPAPKTAHVVATTGGLTYIEVPCGLPGDSIELRTGLGAAIGAVVGGIVGLPVFLVGAVPGAIIVGFIGALIGASSYAIDTGRLQQQGLCG
ncbi:hypothetical protein [Nocardia callitridis]|uniref:Uncharacterized protein n=1 Tax=Nocardia callitridis TaxID=648753 RepID=A0ABP9JWW9_9NOCA